MIAHRQLPIAKVEYRPTPGPGPGPNSGGADGDCHRWRADELWIVCSIFNPRRFRSRVDLYHEFAAYVRASGARLFTVEAAFGDREYEVTRPGEAMSLQLRTNDELWHKERMLNLGLQRLPASAVFFALAAWAAARVGMGRDGR